jgi:hypothetical protein
MIKIPFIEQYIITLDKGIMNYDMGEALKGALNLGLSPGGI